MLNRRQVAKLGTTLGGVVAGLAVAGPIVGFVLSPAFQHQTPLAWRRVGRVDDLPLRTPTRFVVRFPEGYWSSATEPWGCYVVRLSEHRTIALSNVCTHMQCAVRWQADLHQFECPCHGGLYTIEGTNVGGPPPKPLPQWVHRIEDGVLYVANRLQESI